MLCTSGFVDDIMA